MNILYVIGSMQIGGAERHLLRVTSELVQSGMRIHVFAFHPEGPLRHLFIQAGVVVHGFDPPAWLRRSITHPRAQAWTLLMISAARLWWTMWQIRPQAIHFFLPAAYVVGGVVSLFGPRTVRIMSRRSMNYYQLKHRLFARVERWLHRRMDRITGNSQAVIDQLTDDEGVARERLRLIYNGIEAAQFQAPTLREATRRAEGLPPDALVYIMVANLIPYKGHADLIDAFALIRDRLPVQWRLLIVGRDDGIQPELSSRCIAAGLAGHVLFLGARSDIPALLSCSDVGVLCSHEEGFSNAVLEAMAAGLPMVVTDVGGNAEAVVDGEHGYVVPARQPQRLGAALLSVAGDEARSEMGTRGQRRVLELFSMMACTEGYKALYRELVVSA